jgi:hypothetical protein
VRPDETESIDELLKRRAQAATTGAAVGGPLCGDPELLAAYAENSLDSEERDSLQIHLASCAACREAVAALVRIAPREVVMETPAPAASSWWKQWIWAPALASLLVAGSWWMMNRQRAVEEPNRISKRDVSSEPRLPASSPASPAPLAAPRQEPKRVWPRKTAPVQKEPASTPPVASDIKETKDAAGGGGSRQVPAQEATDGALRKQEPLPALALGAAFAPTSTQTQQGSLPPPPAVPSPVLNLPVQNSANQVQNAPPAPSANNQVVGGNLESIVVLPPNAQSEKSKSQAIGDQVNVVRTQRPLASAPAPAVAGTAVAGTAGAARALAKKMIAPAKGRIEKGAFQLSTDDGATWRSIVTPDAVVSFQITDASNFEIRTRTLAAFRTKDGGKTWQPKESQP